MNKILTIEQIKDEISLVDLLKSLGYSPVRKSSKDLFYLSMLREEKTPSFCVNEKLGVWFDHGGPNKSGIKGGTIIDFALAYWHPATLREIVEKISNIFSNEIKIAERSEKKKEKRPRIIIPVDPYYTIVQIKDLGNNSAITDYLKSRGIWEVAKGRLKEIYYSVKSKDPNKIYFSAGWQNVKGNWELRNKIGDKEFKTCTGNKAISFYPNSTDQIAMFEGYMDYLTWLLQNPDSTSSIIVLNSINLLQTAINRAKDYNIVDVYFDRDEGGKDGYTELKKSIPHAEDKSSTYEGFKDFNAKLMAELSPKLYWDEKGIFEKILSTYRR